MQRFGGIPPYPETQNYVERILGHSSSSNAPSFSAPPAV